ncbi:multidrug DMT transporter permease [Alcaligenaceae bacterium SJ-26]|nr:multidrug DMT transporter permease [Alcaligenaceae bacterium SJ-26]
MSSSPKPSMPALTKVALAGSALLCIAGLAAFWYASGKARERAPHADAQQVTVTIRDNLCDPGDITVPAGRTTFTIVNQTPRALEWEILDGVMVVDERENIAPGFSQTLTVKLRPGTFAITCGLLSNPRGTLTVTPSAQSEADAARPPLTEYIGPLAEYKVYMVLTAGAVQKAVQQLQQAVANGSLDGARHATQDAHRTYKRLEPVAELFADLDTRLNARADYFDQRENDPDFAGFYKARHLLAERGDMPALQAELPALQADVDSLRARVRTLQISPERLAQAGARSLRRAAGHLGDSTGSASQQAWSDLDLVKGTRDGTRKIAALLEPLLVKANPDLQARISRDLDTLDQSLEASPVAPATVATALNALADDFDQINPALGLE